MAALDYVALRWEPTQWRVDEEPMISELTDNWFGLIGATE